MVGKLEKELVVGCLFFLFALAVPRVLMGCIFLFTNWFSQAYQSMLWPLIGFFFLPYTTLAYMLAMLQNGALSGGWLVIFIVALFIDLGQGGHATHRTRYVVVQR